MIRVLTCLAALGFSYGAAWGAAPSGNMPADLQAFLKRDPALAARLGTAHWWQLDGIGPSQAQARVPAIDSGEILSTDLHVQTAPGAPAVQAKFTAANGISSIIFGFTSPSGKVIDVEYDYQQQPTPATGQIKVQTPESPFSLYAQPGVWTMTFAGIEDNSQLLTYYMGSNLAALFPSLTMNVYNNNKPDFTPPTFSTGTIVTPTVDASGTTAYFKVSLKVADDVSGVSNIYIELQAPNGFQTFARANIPAPTKAGMVTASANIEGGAAGTWNIIGIQIEDAAGNEAEDFTAADIMKAFGTTSFTVTN